ncbi:MAG: hypothetical protein ABSF37_08455 [Sedimentisphaerales bacterium]
MRYITLFAMAIAFAGGCQKTYVTTEAQKAKLSDAELREVFKAECLGEELYLQDTVAAKASRMLLQTVGPIKPGELSGWIVVKDGAKNLTRFIRQTGENINVIYDVRIDVKGDAEVTKDNLSPLSKTEIAMFLARRNAMRAAPKDCARAYNTAVIEDIDSNSWLVYILAATKENVIVVGGHSRVKVSPDGNNVLAVTPLYKSCLTVPIPADSNNAKKESLYVSYPVADVPSEIHVYLNRLHGYPVYVTTARGNWLVKDGRILLFKPAEKTESQEINKAQQKK